MLAIPDRLVSPAQQAERAGLYEHLPRARVRTEGAIAFHGALAEVDISFIGDAFAMTAALIGPRRHVKTASFRAVASGPEAPVHLILPSSTMDYSNSSSCLRTAVAG